ncbi:MAG: hypothetical protein OEM02_00255 [Desulfobulbaceae bacterium]|nr:hypothetical protein [Desulfobulbaceae bacterium]
MSFQPDSLQTLYLWSILFKHEGTAFLKDLKPKLGNAKGLTGAKRRNQLVKEGLLDEEKIGNKIQLTLTDSGWAWAQNNMTSEISSKSPSSGPVLQALLTRLGSFMDHNEISLAELFIERTQEDSPLQNNQEIDLKIRIRDYWQKSTGGRRDLQVRLTDLREELNDINRQLLDSTITEMHSTGKLILSPLEDPRDVTDIERKAAISIAGEENHIFFME